jgi:hypothetical protein
MAMLLSTRVLALVALLSGFGLVSAAAPRTLGNQGHLADSGGPPIDAGLWITLRL